MQVFISYSRIDVEFAHRLRAWIHTLGYKTWFDQDNIAEGVYWPDAIDSGLKSSDVVIGIMTPASLASRNVKNEWDWSLANNKRLVLPMLHQCKPDDIPHRYISLNYIDFTKDETAGFARLQAALVGTQTGVAKIDAMDGTPAAIPTPRHSHDHNKEQLLHKVKEFWIEGVLETSINGSMSVNIAFGQKPEAVLQHLYYPKFTLKEDASIGKIFQDVNRELLILGTPGSGKTTLLLDLARDLLYRAEIDETKPIPVVFNLSSWALRRKPLEWWLIDELNLRYQIPRKIAKFWIDNGDITPLLDGLDEVKFKYRDDCVETINLFRQRYHYVDLAICSRLADYSDLTSRLNVNCAISLQPLTHQQIASYLDGLGDQFEGLRTILLSDEILRTETTSPLMLNIMTTAYRGLAADSLGGYSTLELRRRHLLDNYIRVRLKDNDSGWYSFGASLHYLSWLASRMQQQSQTIFYIEELQPYWLEKPTQRFIYQCSFRLIGGVVGALTGAWLGSIIGELFTHSSFFDGHTLLEVCGALLGGLFLGLLYWFLIGNAGDEVKANEAIRWSWQKTWIGLTRGLIFGLLVGD